jgi:dihydroorotate dehydrogenase electron transfer subunit
VKPILRHLDAGIPIEPRAGDGALHWMHPRGFGLPPAVVSEYIRTYTKEGDIVLDPFGGNGTTAIEALRLGRRAVTTDPNPLASFFTEVVFTPASLPRLEWAFEDLRFACRDAISELFATACPKCGKKGVVNFLHRENGKLVRLDYSCPCSPGSLSKKPDAGDWRVEGENADADIPFWHPTSLPLPAEPEERFRYPANFLRRRTVAALSIILNSVDNITQPAVRDAMKLAFASSLAACHSKFPLALPGTAAGRNLPPKLQAAPQRGAQKCTVANPWDAFAESFRRMYAGKKESNALLRNAAIGYGYGELESGQANVVILGKSAEDVLTCELPEHSVDYVLTEPPFGIPENGFYLPAIQAAWLRMEFDYNREIVVAPERGRSLESYRDRMHIVFRGLRRAAKEGSIAHFFCGNSGGAEFSEFLNLLESGGLGAEHIHYQRVMGGSRSQNGGYLVRVPVSQKPTVPTLKAPSANLYKKAADAARELLSLYGRKITVEKILHAFYQRLDRSEIASLSGLSIDELLTQAVESFAQYRNGRFTFLKGKGRLARKHKLPEKWRTLALDAESLAAGDPSDAMAARNLAIQRLAREGLTEEDALSVRQSLRPAEIRLHRRMRTSALLRNWGKALGHATHIPKNRPGVILWKTSGNRKVGFTLGVKDIRIASHLKDGTVSEWGVLSYLDLERRLGEWCRNHPAAGADLLQRCAPCDDFLSLEQTDPLRKTSPTKDLKLKVIQNRKILAGHFLIELELRKDPPLDFLPGQFFHVLCDSDSGKSRAYPLTLRRPLSIHRADYPGFDRATLAHAGDLPEEIRQTMVRHPARIDFLYRVAGRGTESLSRIRKGAVVDAIGPCGNGFGIGEARTAVIVAGGIGVAPLAALAERLRQHGKEVLIYLGAVRKEMLGLAVGRPDWGDPLDGARADQQLYDAIHSEFDEIGAQVLSVCTDDGSLGEKGLVTEMLEAGIRDGCVPLESVCLYACGPEGMLRAVAEIAARYSLDCQVSMERRMACAVGACYSCTTRVIGPDGKVHQKRVCREGPVFPARDIQWKD